MSPTLPINTQSAEGKQAIGGGPPAHGARPMRHPCERRSTSSMHNAPSTPVAAARAAPPPPTHSKAVPNSRGRRPRSSARRCHKMALRSRRRRRSLAAVPAPRRVSAANDRRDVPGNLRLWRSVSARGQRRCRSPTPWPAPIPWADPMACADPHLCADRMASTEDAADPDLKACADGADRVAGTGTHGLRRSHVLHR